MKQILLALVGLFALATASHAQQQRQLNGFLEIPWGTAAEQARVTLEARTQATYDAGSSNRAKLWWDGGTFAGHPAAAVHAFALEFPSNKLSKAVVFLKPISPGHKDEYKALKKLLTEKYGTRNSEQTTGEQWNAEWKFTVAGSKDTAVILLENAPGDQGCKISYALIPSPASLSPSSGKKDL